MVPGKDYALGLVVLPQGQSRCAGRLARATRHLARSTRTLPVPPLAPEYARSSADAPTASDLARHSPIAFAAYVGRPIVHQPPPAFEQVRPGVGSFDLVLDNVGQRRLDHLARVVRLLSGPVPEGGAESVRPSPDTHNCLFCNSLCSSRDLCSPFGTPQCEQDDSALQSPGADESAAWSRWAACSSGHAASPVTIPSRSPPVRQWSTSLFARSEVAVDFGAFRRVR